MKDERGKKTMEEGGEVRKRGENENTKERMTTKGRGHNHRKKSDKDGKREKTMLKKFKLKRMELERAPLSNGNL
jgi:hypothetical protein